MEHEHNPGENSEDGGTGNHDNDREDVIIMTQYLDSLGMHDPSPIEYEYPHGIVQGAVGFDDYDNISAFSNETAFSARNDLDNISHLTGVSGRISNYSDCNAKPSTNLCAESIRSDSDDSTGAAELDIETFLNTTEPSKPQHIGFRVPTPVDRMKHSSPKSEPGSSDDTTRTPKAHRRQSNKALLTITKANTRQRSNSTRERSTTASGWRLIGKDKKNNSSKHKDSQDVDMCSQSDTTLLTAYDAQSTADYSTPQPQTKRRTPSRKRAKSKGKGDATPLLAQAIDDCPSDTSAGTGRKASVVSIANFLNTTEPALSARPAFEKSDPALEKSDPTLCSESLSSGASGSHSRPLSGASAECNSLKQCDSVVTIHTFLNTTGPSADSASPEGLGHRPSVMSVNTFLTSSLPPAPPPQTTQPHGHTQHHTLSVDHHNSNKGHTQHHTLSVGEHNSNKGHTQHHTLSVDHHNSSKGGDNDTDTAQDKDKDRDREKAQDKDKDRGKDKAQDNPKLPRQQSVVSIGGFLKTTLPITQPKGYMRAFSVDSGSLVSGSEVSMNDEAHTALSRNTSTNTIGDTSQMSFMGFLQTYASIGIPEPSDETDTDADADLRFKRRSSTGKMKRKITLSSIFPGQSVGVKGKRISDGNVHSSSQTSLIGFLDRYAETGIPNPSDSSIDTDTGTGLPCTISHAHTGSTSKPTSNSNRRSTRATKHRATTGKAKATDKTRTLPPSMSEGEGATNASTNGTLGDANNVGSDGDLSMMGFLDRYAATGIPSYSGSDGGREGIEELPAQKSKDNETVSRKSSESASRKSSGLKKRGKSKIPNAPQEAESVVSMNKFLQDMKVTMTTNKRDEAPDKRPGSMKATTSLNLFSKLPSLAKRHTGPHVSRTSTNGSTASATPSKQSGSGRASKLREKPKDKPKDAKDRYRDDPNENSSCDESVMFTESIHEMVGVAHIGSDLLSVDSKPSTSSTEYPTVKSGAKSKTDLAPDSDPKKIKSADGEFIRSPKGRKTHNRKSQRKVSQGHSVKNSSHGSRANGHSAIRTRDHKRTPSLTHSHMHHPTRATTASSVERAHTHTYHTNTSTSTSTGTGTSTGNAATSNGNTQASKCTSQGRANTTDERTATEQSGPKELVSQAHRAPTKNTSDHAHTSHTPDTTLTHTHMVHPPTTPPPTAPPPTAPPTAPTLPPDAATEHSATAHPLTGNSTLTSTEGDSRHTPTGTEEDNRGTATTPIPNDHSAATDHLTHAMNTQSPENTQSPDNSQSSGDAHGVMSEQLDCAAQSAAVTLSDSIDTTQLSDGVAGRGLGSYDGPIHSANGKSGDGISRQSSADSQVSLDHILGLEPTNNFRPVQPFDLDLNATTTDPTIKGTRDALKAAVSHGRNSDEAKTRRRPFVFSRSRSSRDTDTDSAMLNGLNFMDMLGMEPPTRTAAQPNDDDHQQMGRGRKDSKEKKGKGKKDKHKPKSKNDLALKNSQSCIEMGGSAATGIAVCTPDGTDDESDTDFFTMLKEDPHVRSKTPRGSSTRSPRFSRRWASDDDVLVNHHKPKNSSTLSTHHSNTTTTNNNNNNNNTLEPIGTPKSRSRSSSTGSRFRAMSSGGSGSFRAMALRAASPFEGSGSKPTHTFTGTGTGTDHSPSPSPTHHAAQLHHASSDGSPRAHPHNTTQLQGKTMHTHAQTHAQASRQTTDLQAFSWAEFLEKVTDPAHATNNHATSAPFRDTHAHARRYTEGSAVSNNSNSANGATSPHTTRHTASGDTRSGVAALRDPHSLPTLTAPALDAPRSLPAIGVERDPMLRKGSVVLAKFSNLRSDGDTTPTESEAPIIRHPRMGVTTAQRALVQKTWTTVVTPADDALPTFFLTEIIRVFFGDLYTQMPELKAKFRNVAVESRGFASMMQHVILRPFDGVDTELIRSIGLQHIAQGITEEMYVAMAKSVLVLFHKRLPEGEYTAEVQEAFLASFCTASAYMLNANTAKYVKRKLVNTYNNLFRQILGSASSTNESSESFTNRFTGFMRSGRSRNNTNARGGKDDPSQAAADLNSCSDNNLLRGGIAYPIEMDSAVLNRAGSNPTMTNGGLSSTSSLGEPIDSDSTFSPRQKLTEFFSSSRRGSKSKITKGLVGGPSDSTAPETTNNLSPHRHKLSRTNSSLLGGSTSPTMRKSTSVVSLSDLLPESERGGGYSSNPSTPVTVFADNDRGARQRIGSPLRARSNTKFSSTISNNSPLISNNPPRISTAYAGTSVWEHNDLYQGQDNVLPVDRSG